LWSLSRNMLGLHFSYSFLPFFPSFSFSLFDLIWKNNKLICVHHVFQIIHCMEENVWINVLMDLVQTMPFVLVSFSSSFSSYFFLCCHSNFLYFFSSWKSQKLKIKRRIKVFSDFFFILIDFKNWMKHKWKNHNRNKWIVGLGVGLTFGLLFLILLAILVLLFIKRQKKKQMEKFSEISMVFFFFFFSFSLFLLLTNFFFRITLGKKG